MMVVHVWAVMQCHVSLTKIGCQKQEEDISEVDEGEDVVEEMFGE